MERGLVSILASSSSFSVRDQAGIYSLAEERTRKQFIKSMISNFIPFAIYLVATAHA